MAECAIGWIDDVNSYLVGRSTEVLANYCDGYFNHVDHLI